MPDELLGRRTADPSVGLTLRLLAQESAAALAVLVSTSDGRATIEEAHPPVGRIGQRIRVPADLIADRARAIEARDRRIPLDWTQLTGERPDRMAAAPIDDRGLHLVLAVRGERPVDLQALTRWAALIDHQLAQGKDTARRIDASRRIAALIDNLPIPIVFVDGKSIQILLNDQARSLLGVERQEDGEREVAAALTRLIADDGEDHGGRLAVDPAAEMAFTISHGPAAIEVSSRWIDEEQLTGRLWVFRDVTHQRLVERLKDELVSTVSHELRTPLTAIIGALTLLRQAGGARSGAADPSLVDIAWRNSQRLLRIVNDLLDLDKVGSGTLELRRSPIDVRLLIDQAIDDHRPMAMPGAIVLVGPDAGARWTAAWDAGRISQVVSNLLANAIRLCRHGGVVQVSLDRQDDGFVIGVEDEGPGIPPAFHDRLFTRFAQAHPAAEPGRSGTGLGLAITKAIVEAHGGWIRADPARTSGALFQVYLPAGEVDVPA